MSATPDRILATVTTAFVTLLEAGKPYEGLIPSILDPTTGTMPSELPESVPGQRSHDRAPNGCNLLHDIPLLRAIETLGNARNDSRFVDAVDRYLETFARECTGTESGLFPWGEHAYWDLEAEETGNGYANSRTDPGPAVHDQLHHVPAWFWRRLAEHDEAAVRSFADGLESHWIDEEHSEFNRHAFITTADRYPTDRIDGRSCDFPRHSGHFIYDWSVALAARPDAQYDQWISELLAYWWDRSDLHYEGLLPMESRGYNESPDPGQTLSLAISLLDAAEILQMAAVKPSLRTRLREAGSAYLDAYLTAGNAAPGGRALAEPIWGSMYGGAPPGATAASEALKLLCAYRNTGRDRLLSGAERVARRYRDSSFPSNGEIVYRETALDPPAGLGPAETLPVWAFSAGNAIGLFADLYAITTDRDWAAVGLSLAEEVRSVYFQDRLPRAAGGLSHYENQLGTGYLLYNLTRLALLADTRANCPLGPCYAAR